MGKFKTFLATALAFGIVAPALAADEDYIDAIWLRPKTGKTVKTIACGDGLGLVVVHSGEKIACGAKSVGENKYKGDIRNPYDGNTYSGTVQLFGDKLVLSGCILAGLICQEEIWKRVK